MALNVTAERDTQFDSQVEEREKQYGHGCAVGPWPQREAQCGTLAPFRQLTGSSQGLTDWDGHSQGDRGGEERDAYAFLVRSLEEASAAPGVS